GRPADFLQAAVNAAGGCTGHALIKSRPVYFPLSLSRRTRGTGRRAVHYSPLKECGHESISQGGSGARRNAGATRRDGAEAVQPAGDADAGRAARAGVLGQPAFGVRGALRRSARATAESTARGD